jgi:membrane protein DedA with SNARE-associated domain
MPAAAPKPFDRRALALFAVPMAILTISGWIGDAFAPALLDSAPLVLLLCNPRLRNLVLVSPLVDFWPFVGVAVGRLVISDPLFYWFGRRYGDGAIRWMERRLGPGAKPVLWAERVFRKAAWPAVALIPNNMICLLAGATGMAWVGFAIVNLTGTFVRILGVRLIGDAFSDPILAVNDWIGENRIMLTVITFGLTLLFVSRSMRTGRDPIETPADLARDLEGDRVDADEDADPEVRG